MSCRALAVALAACLAGVGVGACGGTSDVLRADTTTPGGAPGTRLPPIIYRPPGLSRKRKVPLVVVLRGAGTNIGPQQMEGLTHFVELAQAKRFVVAIPDSDDAAAPWKPPSDFAYVSALIARLEKTENIDPNRIYATGFSAGGYETFSLGCKLSRVVAAIAVVSDGMAPRLYDSCHLARPVSMLLMVGTQDIYYAGGGKLPSAAEAAARWRQLDRCAAGPVSTQQVSAVLQRTWTSCSAGSAVALYLVQGAGHVWPPYGPGAPKDYSASAAVWAFFASHRG